jgi:hypothetical protein
VRALLFFLFVWIGEQSTLVFLAFLVIPYPSTVYRSRAITTPLPQMPQWHWSLRCWSWQRIELLPSRLTTEATEHPEKAKNFCGFIGSILTWAEQLPH